MFTRGPAGAGPDYLLTGDYWPVGYWPVYWTAYGLSRGGSIMGDGLITAQRSM
jgi:hypothetical protein